MATARVTGTCMIHARNLIVTLLWTVFVIGNVLQVHGVSVVGCPPVFRWCILFIRADCNYFLCVVTTFGIEPGTV
jgi:hypothetical protein